ncbi:hypothetical protein KFL_002460020 [Klebsormidium nitens]|uniref:Uncharacterized protein n=1 Tax=Klebsormidium nitens TaxID=105231 RepID=A0A1Y1I3V3_KLENI|nr:hypothetical protein KFL_002460020 [Klebsormidium nitens]|eukprot:GAQ85625.1 hypothetical protein KFL_002460020 [Klebsormidium nitens]
MASSNPLSVTPPRRYQRTGDLLVEDVQKDDEWLYSPSTEPSPVLSNWDDDGAPPNLRTSFDRNLGGQSQMERSNSLRGKLGLEPRSSSRSSSQSVTPHELSPLGSRRPSQEDYVAGMSQRISEARFQDRALDEPSPKQSLFELRTMFRDDNRAKQEVQEGTRRMSAPSPIALRRASSNIPTPPGHAPPSSVPERGVSRESPSPSIIERSLSSGSRIPFAPGSRRSSSVTPSSPAQARPPSPTPPNPSPRRASDGGSHLAAYRPATPESQRPGYAAMQARVKAGLVHLSPSPAREKPPGGLARTPPSSGGSPRVSDRSNLRRASSSPSRNNTARAGVPGQTSAGLSSPATPASTSRVSSAGSFSGRTGPASSSGNMYMTPASGTPGRLYMSPSRTGNKSVNQPAKPAYGSSSTRSLSMGSSSKAGFNSSVPRTFTFLEDPTPKRRGSALEREEMASLTQDTSPAASGGYLFPDEESPRRPVADTNDQSWAHVRTAVAQAKRSRSMGAGSPRDGNGSAKTVGRGDPMRTSSVRSSAERSNLRLSGGLVPPGQTSSFNGGEPQMPAASLLAGKRTGSSGNLAAAEHSPSFAAPSNVNRASYYPPGIAPPGTMFQPEMPSFQPEMPSDVRKQEKAPGVMSSDDESWGPGEGSKDGSVSGESGPWTGSLASEDDELVGGKPDKGGAKAGSKKRRRFRKSRTRFRGTESGVEGDESEIDVDTASLATAGSPLPGNLMTVPPDNQSLPDTASDTMSVDAAEGGAAEGRGSDRLLTRGGRRDGVEVLEPLPDVSIDAEEGVMAVRSEHDVAPAVLVGMESQREADAGRPNLGAAIPTLGGAVLPTVTRDEQSQTEDVLTEKEPASSRGEWRSEDYSFERAEGKPKKAEEVVFPAAANLVGSGLELKERPVVATERSGSAAPVVAESPPPMETDQVSVPASQPRLSFEETPIVAKGSFAAALEGPISGQASPGPVVAARNELNELPVTGPVASSPAAVSERSNGSGPALGKTASQLVVEETAVEKVGMTREGQLPDEIPLKPPASDPKPVAMEVSKAMADEQASKDVPEAAAAETSPVPKPKPPVLSFDDIPVRGVQGIFGERPPVHSPPAESPSPAKPAEKRGPVSDPAAPRPSTAAQEGAPKQGPKGEGVRRIRSAGGSGQAALGLRAGSSGANLEKAIASMNRRNTMRRSSDRSTATGASENYEWERSSLADETYSDISTPSTMLSRKTLEEAAESAIFCSSIVHDLVYQAASLAQEKEDLAKLGKASGELVKLVSKQRGPEIDRIPAAGIGAKRSNGGTASGLEAGKESGKPPKAKKQPACGCTIL